MESTSQWITALGNSFNDILKTIIAQLPNVLTALALFIAGWILAKILKMLILRLATGVDRIYQTTWLKDKQVEAERRYTFSRFLSEIVFWFVILFFLSVSVETLGLELFSKWMKGLYSFVPNIFASFVIIFFGYILSSTLKVSISRLKIKDAVLFSQLVSIAVLTLTVLLGLAQLGINIRLLTNILTITIGVLLGGCGLAFGLGAASTVGNIIAAHYIKKNYEPGQVVKISDMEGKILELTPTTVVIATSEGKATLPAKQFNDQVVVLSE